MKKIEKIRYPRKSTAKIWKTKKIWSYFWTYEDGTWKKDDDADDKFR